jgi:filamentous hemagglutinin family protein
MVVNVHRASNASRTSRRSLMRGASWLPLAAVALVSNTIDARAQAVNLGGMQTRVRSFDNTVAAGVQRQSPGNNIVADGQTATNVRVHGRTTTITTSTMSGGNAFNSFKTFSEGEGNTVNLIVPDAAGKLVNIVREGPVNVQGVLNSYQNGKIGGKVVFADSYGFVVGASGSINVGGLTVVTPTKATIDRMISTTPSSRVL